MARWDSLDTKVYVATATSTPFTWNLIGSVVGFDHTAGNEGETRRRVFGQSAAIVKAGAATAEYSLDVLYDQQDTSGQVTLRTVKASQAEVALLVCNGDSGAEEGWYELVKITEYTVADTADGDYAEGSFSAVGDTVRNEFTGGLPT